ncbi:MAG: hypothetical protein HZA46_06695 [Planctomycetales bacterium]|nr:hypothetical protein [Planctomycetales bacterium]
MPRQTGMSVAFCLACTIASCRGVSHREMVETKLRQQEDQLADLSSRLDRTQSELLVAQREANAFRHQLHDQGQAVLAAEQSAILHRATELRVQSWLTGGIDRDGQPGDEGLSVLVAPMDSTGDVIKLPGEIGIELLDLSQPVGERLIARRQISLVDSESLWHHGFVGTGYLIELNWERIPTQPDVTLNVKLEAPDGRLFQTTHVVKVRPPEQHSAAAREDESVLKPARFESNGGRPKRDRIAKPSEQPVEDASDSKPVLETSDRFTEPTIPTLR